MNTTPPPLPAENATGAAIEEQLGRIQQLADQAASEGLYGLQDVNLLLAEALQENPSAAEAADLLTLLSTWHELINGYRHQPLHGTQALIEFLRHPQLKIPLTEDEFALLQEQLVTEPPCFEAQLPPTDDNTATVAARPEQETESGTDPASVPVSPVAQELVDLLLLESERVRTYLHSIIADDKNSVGTGLQQAQDELERLVNASVTAGFEGLAAICVHVGNNIQHFVEHLDSFNSARLDLLLIWLNRVTQYLSTFNEADAGQKILTGLTDAHPDGWIFPLPDEEVRSILAQMRTTSTTVGAQSEPARAQTASDDDVSLILPDDVNPELLELLLHELPGHTLQFSEAVQRLQFGGDNRDIELAQRVAHTLKGSANTVGVKGIAHLTHQLEDILIACAKARKPPGRALTGALINAADCLEAMSESLSNFSPPPDDARAVLQDILDWANRIDRQGLSALDTDATQSAARTNVTRTPETSKNPAPLESQKPRIRVASEHIENLFRLSGESIIVNSQALSNSRRMRTQVQAMQRQFTLLQQLADELEQLIDLKDLTGRAIDTSDQGFDTLEMDQYNELHTASRRMAEAALDAREISLDINKELTVLSEVLDDQQRLAIETQEEVMQTRLVAIATIAPRLQRSFRQACRLTGKLSELTLLGENILIDADTLNALIDPIMHLLRNAVDHGIESEEQRLLLGKPQIGAIVLEFEREGNNIKVCCTDDGHGLDYAAIRATALKRGELQPDQAISEEQLQQLLLRPNFSTRSVTSQTSGRGVGMDAVHAQIIAQGGSLILNSETGKGLTVTMTIPLPLSLTHALLIDTGGYRLAVANKGIVQIYHAGEAEAITEEGLEQLRLEGVCHGSVKLDDLLHIPEQRRSQRPYGAVLLVKTQGQTTAVQVDALIDSQDVVIKSLGRYIGKIPGFIGATILGDGTVTPVLDLPELLRAPTRALDSFHAQPMIQAKLETTLPTVMVVDDSLSQRRALEQLLEDAGFKVLTARDGIEAAELLALNKPDLLLTDLEMPRMNGIELTAHIRTQNNRNSRLPVIMITSRSTQKHRLMAEDAGIDAYFTKPVSDQELLLEMQHLLEQTQDRGNQVA